MDGKSDTGKVNVANGSYWGLTTTDSQLWQQNAFPSGGDEDYDNFGYSLTKGDFNGDGYDDLAIGTPYEDLSTGEINSGKVNVLQGSHSGLTSHNSQLWTQDSFPSGGDEDYYNFGYSLATGDFNGDGYDDLAIGTPYEDVDGIADVGKVNVLHGSYYGLTSVNSQLWTQDSFGVEGIAEEYDNFGASLTVDDFNGDGYDDLAIGVSGEDIGGISNSGAVNILYGSTNGLVA
ncbi:MAG: FG-GAP repeat protein [Cyanobacteria bacterium J06635_10]